MQVCQYYLVKSGVTNTDKKIAKLVALAADKFIADIIFDTKQISALRHQSTKRKSRVDDEPAIVGATLEMEDLVRSLRSRKINIRRKVINT